MCVPDDSDLVFSVNTVLLSFKSRFFFEPNGKHEGGGGGGGGGGAMVVVRGKGARRLFSLSVVERNHQLAFPRLQNTGTDH